MRAVPLTAAPARDPTWDQMDLGFDADAASPSDALAAADLARWANVSPRPAIRACER